MQQDAELPLLSEVPSCSHDSEAGTWRSSIPTGLKGVGCIAHELEQLGEQMEEQDPW